MPVRIVIRVGTLRCFSCVDDDDFLWMVDDPRVDGQPLGPSGVSKDSNQPTWLPDAVRRLYVDRACLNGMDIDLILSYVGVLAARVMCICGERLFGAGRYLNHVLVSRYALSSHFSLLT